MTFYNLDYFSTNLIKKDGIYFGKVKSEISYPEKGNKSCFQIEDESFWFNHRNDCIIESVKKYCSDVLFFDVGGGNGFVARGLENSGISTVMVEPGLEGCINARTRKLKNIICSSLENDTFITGSIPAIGLFDVIEHIKTDVEFLRSVNKYLIKNGFVFITVPAYGALWSDEDDYAGHFRRYTLQDIEEKLRKTGFVIVYSTYIFSFLPLPILLFRTLPSRLGRGKKEGTDNISEQEHKRKSGIVDNILNKIWKWELEKIQNSEKIPFGGSCFIIAKKKEVLD